MARKLRSLGFGSAALAATAMLGACVAPPSQPPTQVSSDTPSVTYQYRGDQQLIAANQRAADYCAQFKTMPGNAVVSTGTDGRTEVRFECDKPIPATVAALPPSPPAIAERYHTDDELLIASRNAQRYCLERGTNVATSSVSPNTDGSHTATFQCAPR